MLIGLDARHSLGFWTKPMGKNGQGAPAFHDALRVIAGSGNPPDPLRWTLHSLGFAALHSARLPEPVQARGAGTTRPPRRNRKDWGLPVTRRRADALPVTFLRLPRVNRSQPFGRQSE